MQSISEELKLLIQHNWKDHATDLIMASRPVAYHVFPASEKTLFLVLFDATPFGPDTMTMHIIDCVVQIKFCTVIDRCPHVIFSSDRMCCIAQTFN